MLKRIVLGCLFVLLPGAAWAQTLQEGYLPARSQLYFRWDGMVVHQADFDKTAAGKTMKGDTGKFLREVWKYAQEQLQNAVKNDPNVGQKAAPLLKDFGKLLGSMYDDGVVFGVEAATINPPVVRAVMVFPKAAGESGTLLPLVQRIAEETKADVKSNKVGKRFVNHVEVDAIKFGWWAEGQDALLFLGTTDPVAYAKDIDAKKTGVAAHSLYKKVTGFNEFKTATRGYVDITSILGVASEAAPEAGKIIDELGLKGVKSVTFVSGFDGPANRSVVDIDMPGPRTGLLAFTSQRKTSLKDLPVLPNDVKGFSMTTIKLDTAYDNILNLVDGIARVVAPGEADNVKEAIKAFEGTLGVNISKDVFGNLGDLVVSYSSPSDGFLGTGSVIAMEVKDGKKLSKTLENIVKRLPPTPAGDIKIQKKPYYSGEIYQIQLSGMTSTNIATIGMYKKWLVYSKYPVAVKGFILRQEGELPAWKADDALTKSLQPFPKEFSAIQVSDPRPTLQTVLSVLPVGFDLINTIATPLVPGFRPFDLDLIPHPQEATRHLFPNITVTTDDGKRIRSETRGSTLLPF
jgi:hypothetical protein